MKHKTASLYLILWEFRVRRGRERKFERIYGSRGDWAQLFRRARGYRGTQLWRDTRRGGRHYVVLDMWASRANFLAFKKRWAKPYKALDIACLSLTESETPIGTFTVSP